MSEPIYISIIIPVYNVSCYIKKTLDSIYNQLMLENLFEVIVVNDGSKDETLSIVSEYEKEHLNLYVINQENQGLSCARNTGMRLSKGDYIWFVDGDDYVSENSLTEIIETLKKNKGIEIFCFGINEIRKDSVSISSIFSKKIYERYYGEVNDGYFYCRKLPTGICQRFLFYKKFLEESNLQFTPHIYHEDLDFLNRAYTKASLIMPLKTIWYNYVVRESGSITSTFNLKRFEDVLWIISNLRNCSKNTGNGRSVAILENGVFSLCFYLLDISYRDREEYKLFLKENGKEIKVNLIRSYFKSLRKNSLGKTYKFLKSIILL